LSSAPPPSISTAADEPPGNMESSHSSVQYPLRICASYPRCQQGVPLVLFNEADPQFCKGSCGFLVHGTCTHKAGTGACHYCHTNERRTALFPGHQSPDAPAQACASWPNCLVNGGIVIQPNKPGPRYVCHSCSAPMHGGACSAKDRIADDHSVCTWCAAAEDAFVKSITSDVNNPSFLEAAGLKAIALKRKNRQSNKADHKKSVQTAEESPELTHPPF
jgi:hypothetical protein